jgi:hypothetical protein
MGGLGSGRRPQYDKKRTVEESLVISIGRIHNRRRSLESGILSWRWGYGHRSHVGFITNWLDYIPSVTLLYRRRDGMDVESTILLLLTPTRFNGRRWWFLCPLCDRRGIMCARRVSKLYLPPRARRFGCRLCHNLTYRSCQEAHSEVRWGHRLDLIEHWIDRHADDPAVN